MPCDGRITLEQLIAQSRSIAEEIRNGRLRLIIPSADGDKLLGELSLDEKVIAYHIVHTE